MTDTESITAEELNDIKEFNESYDRYYEASGRYASLVSQGKYCPPNVLLQAKLETLVLRKIYENTKIYKTRNHHEASQAIMYKLATFIRAIRERNR